MLFTFFEIKSPASIVKDIHNFLAHKSYSDDPRFQEVDNSLILYFSQSGFSNCIITQFDDKPYLLANTFDISKIQKIESFLSINFQMTITPVKISTTSFKNILKLNYPIIELDAIIHEPIYEEISISGTDIQNSEFYKLIIEEGEIQKLVFYLDSIDDERIGGVIKIFHDGKISIIPELKLETIPKLFNHILKRLEIV